MLGDFSCRVILNIIGFVWPAYQNFKTISQKQTDATQRWCTYWLMLALFTVSERMVLDMLVFWVPMYYEAKVLFVLYLWHPKTQGAVYLYNSMLQPFLSQNEGAIDQCIEELKSAFFDYAAHYFQRLVIFVQTNAHAIVYQLQQLQAKVRVTVVPPVPACQRLHKELAVELLKITGVGLLRGHFNGQRSGPAMTRQSSKQS